MFMAGFHGTRMTRELYRLITEEKIGGIILFSRNIESKKQVSELCADAAKAAGEAGLPPLWIAVDQEGGSVARLKPPEFFHLPAADRVNSPDHAFELFCTAARELKEIGFNMNMAPVCDIAPQGFDSVMRGRSYGTDPREVGRKISAVIMALQGAKIAAVAKHFPGIGRTTLDSHKDLPDLDLPVADLERFEIKPFARAIESGVCGVMLSHVRYKSIDPEFPASLSQKAVHFLRKRLGFRGIVITDDLDMGAVRNHFDTKTIGGRILESGIDIALVCHRFAEIPYLIDIVAEKALSGHKTDRITASFERIISAKSIFTA